jgi:hypothetical protein
MSAWPVGSCPIARRGGGEDSTSHTQHAKRDTQHAQRYKLGLALEARYKLNANLAKTPPQLVHWLCQCTACSTEYPYWYSVLQVVPVVPRLVSQRV